MYAKNIRPSAKHDDRIERLKRAQICKQRRLRAMEMCTRSKQIFCSVIIDLKVNFEISIYCKVNELDNNKL